MKCKIKDIFINYEIKGKGKPVIMLHGYSPDHRLMTGCMEPVFDNKDGYKRIYIDLPGMGKSESAEWITNSDIMLDIVIDFIEEIIPNENFLIVGESYGSYLSRGVIYNMSERVDGVLLICPCIIADSKKRDVPEHIVLVKDNKLLSRLTLEDAEEFSSIAVVQSKKNYERYKKEIMSGLKIADNKFLEQLKENGYNFSFDVDKINKKIDKPALIIVGRQDTFVGYRDAWNILENYPRATFAVLDRAGHNLQIEQEKLFNSLTNEWLTRVEES
ncbi:MAG: alpha/beta hydrolase [Firmicutes bacterium]|nr:alpha/beta hydrolase [Bacillota bacterium]